MGITETDAFEVERRCRRPIRMRRDGLSELRDRCCVKLSARLTALSVWRKRGFLTGEAGSSPSDPGMPESFAAALIAMYVGEA